MLFLPIEIISYILIFCKQAIGIGKVIAVKEQAISRSGISKFDTTDMPWSRPAGSLKLVSSKNISDQFYFDFTSQHQKLSAKTVEYRVIIAQPHPRWDIGLEHPFRRYRVFLARTIKSRRAGRGGLPSTLVNLCLGIDRSRICGCRWR